MTVAAVPWARHGAGHTRDFDDLAAWLAVRTSKSAVMELLRVAWRTVGSIVTRVNADIDATVDRLDGLRRIGIDEISYKRGHRYLIVVVDHDRGRLVWAGTGPQRHRPGTCSSTSSAPNEPRCSPMFRPIWPTGSPASSPTGPRTRCAAPIRSMSSRGRSKRSTSNAAAPGTTPKAVAPPAVSASHAKDARPATRKHISKSRYALWKNPGDLTGRQRDQLDWIAKTDPRLWRAYLLKEGLRYVFAVKGNDGKIALDRWASWARRSRIPAFVQLQRRIRTHREAIDVALDTGLSQGLIESTNTKIRLLTRVAFGFHGHEPLIALAMLALGSHPPRLPGRD